jgi:hypothetical protein
MTRAELLLAEDAVSFVEDRIELRVRQPWYRSLPLSSVVKLEVRVNGRDIPQEEIVFALEGIRYALADIAEHWETVWFIQDSAVVSIPGTTDPTIHLEVALTLRFPYIIIDGVGPLTRRTVAERTIDVKEIAR